MSWRKTTTLEKKASQNLFLPYFFDEATPQLNRNFALNPFRDYTHFWSKLKWIIAVVALNWQWSYFLLVYPNFNNAEQDYFVQNLTYNKIM